MRKLVDAHLDLAWNAASFDRDLTLKLNAINHAETEMDDRPFRGNATVSFSEMRRGNIGLSIVTLLARSGPQHVRQKSYHRCDLDSSYRIGAYAAAHAQLACYHLWEQQGHLCLIKNKADFDSHLSQWKDSLADDQPLGVILSMEGADPIVEPSQLSEWHNEGLRAIGPAHYGHSHYASGTAVAGPITPVGRHLLGKMNELSMGLDVTHLCDQSLNEALDLFEGTVWASHHNCRTLVPGDRQLPDEIIQRLIERDSVIGAVCDAWMLQSDWVIGKTTPEQSDLKIDAMADHIDHVCQMAGNSYHSAIGSDLDGGYGTEQTPSDLKSIADLHKLEQILLNRGYKDEDVDNIFYKNWLRLIRKVLPESPDGSEL